MVKVSIVIPRRNRSQMLLECLTSVWHQTFHNYEVIICDNNSKDETKNEIVKLKKIHKNITYLDTSIDLTMIENWNRGLREARGEYVCVLMDDDVWEPQFLEKTARILDSYRDVGVVAVQPVPWYTKGTKKVYPRDHYRLYKGDKKLEGITCIEKYLKREWRVGLPSAVLTRRKCLTEVGLFREPGLDPELWLRILSRYNFYYVDSPLTKWRVHTQGSYTAAGGEQRLQSLYILILAIDEVYKNISKRDDGTLRRMRNDTYKQIKQESREVYANLSVSDKIASLQTIIRIHLHGDL